jgi:hypothetical protein
MAGQGTDEHRADRRAVDPAVDLDASGQATVPDAPGT